jgi:hypothetical protein
MNIFSQLRSAGGAIALEILVPLATRESCGCGSSIYLSADGNEDLALFLPQGAFSFLGWRIAVV